MKEIILIVLGIVLVGTILMVAYERGQKLVEDKSYWVKRNALLHDTLYTMLRQTRELFEKYKLVYWISDGTLLGAVRGKRIIYYDDDMDVSLFDDDHFRTVLPMMTRDLQKMGYIVKLHQMMYIYQIIDPNTGANLDWFLYDPKPHVEDETGRTFYHNNTWVIRTMAPYTKIYHDELYPLKQYSFGPTCHNDNEVNNLYWGPGNPWTYLVRNYKEDFYKVGKITHCHQSASMWDTFCVWLGGGSKIVEMDPDDVACALSFKTR